MRKLFAISDVHGDIKALEKAMVQAGLLISKPGRGLVKKKDAFVVQVGDLANCTQDSRHGDLKCLSKVGEWIDYMCIGNHEIPYFDPDNFFNGFYPYEEISVQLWKLYDEGRLVSCVPHGDVLISHAGVTASMQLPMTSMAEKIGYEWATQNFAHSLFRSIGPARYGKHRIGGVLWCDFNKEFEPTDFPQIVGHTTGVLRHKGNAVCIDTKGSTGLPTVIAVD